MRGAGGRQGWSLEVHGQIYVQHRSQINMMIIEAKRKLYCDKLTTGDPKTCFTILKFLKLPPKKYQPIPA